MLLELADHFVVDLVHVSVVWINALESRPHLLELSVKVVFTLLEFSLLAYTVSESGEPTLQLVDLVSILGIPDHVVSVLLLVDLQFLRDCLVISIGHCHSQLFIELLQLEGGISLPLLERIDSCHAADLELSHLFLNVLVVSAQELLLLFETLVFPGHSDQIDLE